MTADTKRGSRIMWVVVAAGVGVVAIGLVFAGRFGTDPTVSASPLIGTQAPAVEIEDFDGGPPIRLPDLEGGIVVVNFWASWCTGCRVEHEALVRAADDYAGSGVTFVAVNYQDVRSGAERFLDDLGRSEATRYGVDNDSRTAFEFGVLGLPETFFIDRDGVVVGKVSGPASYALLAATIDRIAIGEAVGEVTTGDVENR